MKTATDVFLVSWVVVLLAAFASGVLADITIEEAVDIDTLGGTASMAGTRVTAVAGERARTRSDLEFKSAMMQSLAGESGSSAQIVHLDAGRIYVLNPARKEYSVMSFAEMRARTDAARLRLESLQQQEQSGAGEQGCEWSKTKSDLVRTGERKSFAGLEAERNILTVSQVCKRAASGQSCNITWTADQWLTEEMPGGQEALDFWERYAERAGIRGQSGANMQMAQGAMARFSQSWSKAMDKIGELEGYPLRSVVTLEVGGANCEMNTTAGGTATTSPTTVIARVTTETVSISNDPVPADALRVPEDWTEVALPGY